MYKITTFNLNRTVISSEGINTYLKRKSQFFFKNTSNTRIMLSGRFKIPAAQKPRAKRAKRQEKEGTKSVL